VIIDNFFKTANKHIIFLTLNTHLPKDQSEKKYYCPVKNNFFPRGTHVYYFASRKFFIPEWPFTNNPANISLVWVAQLFSWETSRIYMSAVTTEQVLRFPIPCPYNVRVNMATP